MVKEMTVAVSPLIDSSRNNGFSIILSLRFSWPYGALLNGFPGVQNSLSLVKAWSPWPFLGTIMRVFNEGEVRSYSYPAHAY